MHIKRIILILLLFSIKPQIFAQENIADSLLAIEYRIYKSENDTLVQQLLLQRYQLQLHHKASIAEINKTLSRIDLTLITDSIVRKKMHWNKTLGTYLNGEFDSSEAYTKSYLAYYGEGDTDIWTLNYLNLHQKKSEKEKEALTRLIQIDSSYQALNCICEVEDYELKHPGFYKISSILVPGSGLIFLGKPIKGGIALGISTLTVFAIADLFFKSTWFNMIYWGGSLIDKFYLGQIRLTEKLTQEKQAQKKAELAGTCQLRIQFITGGIDFR
ncbi:MAG: hypothetical protein K1X56_05970 [Flavobacteriales bacterium]|nr:hypothetical protein [Flavobacteriales bacterium]